MFNVQILLSTFNGEKYLEQQVESLLTQDYDITKLIIRDDGSTDRTRDILSTLKKKYPNKVTVITGTNVGVIQSFFELLHSVSEEADFISFCDQDDIWKSDKISRAIDLLSAHSRDIPMMYCSRTELVTEELKPFGYWPPIPSRETGFGNALIQNVAVGCTVMINRRALQLIPQHMPDPSKLIMHDWWMYILVSAFGHVIYDDYPSLLYRQHANNVMGGDRGFFSKWKNKYQSFKKNNKKKLLRAQANEFYHIYEDILPEDKKFILHNLLTERLSFIDRWRYLTKSEVYRQSLVEDWLFRMLYLIGRI